MGKISAYPTDNNISDNDKLIGTDAENSNKTKNFTVGDLAAYIQANANAINLQAVTQVGATTNINVTLAGVDAQAITATTGAFSGAVTGGSTGSFTGVVDAAGFEGGYLDFDTGIAPAQLAGRLKWSALYGGMKNDLTSAVSLYVGQQDILFGMNGTGGTLTFADCTTIKIDSITGSSPIFEKATTTDVYGIVANTMANGAAGYIITKGLLTGINASGSLQGEIWADGDLLYNSNSVPGQLTKVSNDAVVGRVLFNSASSGVIWVDVNRRTGLFNGPVTGTTGMFSGAVTGGAGSSFPSGVTTILNLVVNALTELQSVIAVGIEVVNLEVTGDLDGVTAGFTGAVTVGSIASSGAVSGTTGTFSGAVAGTTGTFSGAVSGTTGTFLGVVSGTIGNFSGAVSGTTGTFSGAVSTAGLTTTTFKASDHIKLTGLDTYADNAAALLGGLLVNDVYKTATGELRIVI